jgi:hypothetical protein
MTIPWPDLEDVEQTLRMLSAKKGRNLTWQTRADPATGPGAFTLETSFRGGPVHERWSFPGIPFQAPDLLTLEAKRPDGEHPRHPLWQTLILDGVVAPVDAPGTFGSLLLEPGSHTDPLSRTLGACATEDFAAGRRFAAALLDCLDLKEGARRGEWSRLENDTLALAAALAECWPDRWMGYWTSLYAREALLVEILENRQDLLEQRLSVERLPEYFSSPWRGLMPKNRPFVLGDIVWPAVGLMVNMLDFSVKQTWAADLPGGSHGHDRLPEMIMGYCRLLERNLFRIPPEDVKKFLARLKRCWQGRRMDEIWTEYLGQTLNARFQQACAEKALCCFDREEEYGPCL